MNTLADSFNLAHNMLLTDPSNCRVGKNNVKRKEKCSLDHNLGTGNCQTCGKSSYKHEIVVFANIAFSCFYVRTYYTWNNNTAKVYRPVVLTKR